VLIASFHQSAKWRQEAAVAQAAVEEAGEQGLVTKFHELASKGLVHPNIVNVITKKMKLETMTDVQTRTINEALSGVDM
jgi:ATP-dependent RNA helicase MSS116